MKNNLKTNGGKFHPFLSPNEDETVAAENYIIKSSGAEEVTKGVRVSNNKRSNNR